METYNMTTITIDQLEKDTRTKGDLFKDFPHTFDFAVPQEWIDTFANWCKVHIPKVTYHLILSTTVWSYPEDGGAFGRPVTCCTEVLAAYEQFLVRVATNI